MKKKVLITGCRGNLGKYLSHYLRHQKQSRTHILEASENLLHKSIEKFFQEQSINSVIHLDLIHNPREDWSKRNTYNLSGTHHLIQLCVQYKVKKFIFLSSANLYGPSPRNSQLLTEEAPLLASAYSSGPDDLVKTDLFASSCLWKFPQLDLVILRPCHIVGPLKNGIIHYLSANPTLTLMGYDPMIQLIHIDDLALVIKLCLDESIKGIFNVKGPGEISLHRLLKHLELSYLPLPTLIARNLVTTLWNLQLINFPPYELNHLQYPCMVNDSLLRNHLPYVPQQNLKSMMEQLKNQLHKHRS